MIDTGVYYHKLYFDKQDVFYRLDTAEVSYETNSIQFLFSRLHKLMPILKVPQLIDMRFNRFGRRLPDLNRGHHYRFTLNGQTENAMLEFEVVFKLGHEKEERFQSTNCQLELIVPLNYLEYEIAILGKSDWEGRIKLFDLVIKDTDTKFYLQKDEVKYTEIFFGKFIETGTGKSLLVPINLIDKNHYFTFLTQAFDQLEMDKYYLAVGVKTIKENNKLSKQVINEIGKIDRRQHYQQIILYVASTTTSSTLAKRIIQRAKVLFGERLFVFTDCECPNVLSVSDHYYRLQDYYEVAVPHIGFSMINYKKIEGKVMELDDL